MRKRSLIILILAAILVTGTSTTWAAGRARKPAIDLAADRVVELQRTDTDWEGTWYWYVGDTYNAPNLTGATALGLLEAYRDAKDPAYLDAAIAAADFIMTHLGSGATGTQHHTRLTAPDVVFLHRLGEITGDSSYSSRAITEWDNITDTWTSAADLDALFRAINRPSTWDIAFFLEAAYLSGDATWADDAAEILANTTDSFYYGDTWWYALNLSNALRVLAAYGYSEQYYDSIVHMLNELTALVDKDTGIGGYVQDTAYAVLAFETVGGAAHKYANDLGRWLAMQQQENGGWLEPDGNEYPEADGEALRALASTIGTNVTLDGFETGTSSDLNSSWIKDVTAKAAKPFAD